MISDLRWFAAYVRSRHENKVAAHLERRGVEFFLPQYTSERKWSDRQIEISLPLFPGYVFVRVSIERHDVLRIPGVINLVGAGKTPQSVTDEEIRQLRLSTQPEYRPEPHPIIRLGDQVVVTRGALQGYTGFLLRQKNNKARVVIAVDLVQNAMSIEMDVDFIAPKGNSQWPAQSGKAI